MQWLAIALGGALGTALRYGLNVATVAWLGPALPYGTFAANVVGSFLLGIVMEVAGGREILGTDARLVLGTGVLGGFTTYSSFNLEAIRLAEQGAWARAGGYVGATVVVCVIAGIAGVAAARALKT